MKKIACVLLVTLLLAGCTGLPFSRSYEPYPTPSSPPPPPQSVQSTSLPPQNSRVTQLSAGQDAVLWLADALQPGYTATLLAAGQEGQVAILQQSDEGAPLLTCYNAATGQPVAQRQLPAASWYVLLYAEHLGGYVLRYPAGAGYAQQYILYDALLQPLVSHVLAFPADLYASGARTCSEDGAYLFYQRGNNDCVYVANADGLAERVLIQCSAVFGGGGITAIDVWQGRLAYVLQNAPGKTPDGTGIIEYEGERHKHHSRALGNPVMCDNAMSVALPPGGAAGSPALFGLDIASHMTYTNLENVAVTGVTRNTRFFYGTSRGGFDNLATDGWVLHVFNTSSCRRVDAPLATETNILPDSLTLAPDGGWLYFVREDGVPGCLPLSWENT